MGDLVLEGNFRVIRKKNDNIQFNLKKIYDLNNFNENYGANPDVRMTIKGSILVLKIKKIFTNVNKTIIRFFPNSYNFPERIKNGKIVINRLVKITHSFTASPNTQFVSSCGCGKSISINTNVQSGYSATSFPSTYSATYNLGPYPGRSQTTPMVAWAYTPPGGGY